MKKLSIIQLFLCFLAPIFCFAQITEVTPSYAKESTLTPVQILGNFNPTGVTTVTLIKNGLPVPASCVVTNVLPTQIKVNITLPACGANQGNYYDVVVNNAGVTFSANNSFTPVCQCQAVVQGNIFQDNNNDGIDNGISDPPLGNVLVHALNVTTNTTYIGYTRPNGVLVIAIPVPTSGIMDNYTLCVPSLGNPSLQNKTLSTPNTCFNFWLRKLKCPYPGNPIIANNPSVFGYAPNANSTDLTVNMGTIVVQPDVRPIGYPTTIPNAATCGMAANSMFGLLTLTYTNNGTVATGGTVHFTKPPLTGGPYNWHTFAECYVSAGCTPAIWYTPHTITENGNSIPLSTVTNNTCSGLDYSFPSLAPGQSRTMTMIFEPYSDYAQVAQWFYNINVTASIASVPLSTDTNPADNISTAVVCLPYDPNEKRVSPEGVGTQGYIANGQELTYTIHFQNVGNAPAQHVRLEDLLDANLDISTLQILSYSHPVELDAVNNNITFFFRDIYLPDSMSQPLESQGFVKFIINPKPNLAIGTQIKNHADIYFDFMPAIVTNETTNTIGEPKKGSAEVGIQDGFNSNNSTFATGTIAGVGETHFSIYPNPAQDQIEISFIGDGKNDTKMEIFDVTGKLVKQIILPPNSNHTKASISDLENGVYFCKIVGNQQFTFPLSIQR